MREPGSRFSARVLKVVPTREAVPSISRGVMVRRLPATSWTGLWPLSLPVRILGPCRSARMQMGLPSSFATGADHLDELGLLGVGAVREVEAGDVEAGADELAEDFDGATGRAEGGDDLGATGALRCRQGD